MFQKNAVKIFVASRGQLSYMQCRIGFCMQVTWCSRGDELTYCEYVVRFCFEVHPVWILTTVTSYLIRFRSVWNDCYHNIMWHVREYLCKPVSKWLLMIELLPIFGFNWCWILGHWIRNSVWNNMNTSK